MDRTPPETLTPLSLSENQLKTLTPRRLFLCCLLLESGCLTPRRERSWPLLPLIPSQSNPHILLGEANSQETVVPETPELELDLWMESQSSVLPETPDLEAISEGFKADVPETPLPKRRRKRRVSEEEWFKELLVMLLPGMADLL